MAAVDAATSRVGCAVIAYAARTTNARSVRAVREHGWRVLIQPGHMPPPGVKYALDNGAYALHQRGEHVDVPACLAHFAKLGAGADFVVLPDVVEGGAASLDFSLAHLDAVTAVAPTPVPMLAVQDGMSWDAVERALDAVPRLGLFVGGSTAWKEATMVAWGRITKAGKRWLHVGRVNSMRRIMLCHLAGAQSFDGSSVSRFANSMGRLDAAVRAPALPLYVGAA